MILNNKTAIVTGVSKGIGKSIVTKLLEAGVKVAGWSRSKPDITHPNFLFITTDVANESEVETAFQQSMIFLEGKIDILVNNAGFGKFSVLENTPSDVWENMFAVNVHGLFYTSKRVVPLMKAAHSGHIFNIASIAGLQGVNEATAYCGTKFAVRGISQSLYQEVKKYDVKVTCINPGSVNTPFFANASDNIIANPTMINPDDIANAIVYLANTPSNFSPVELEVRPLNPKYS